MFNQTSIIIVLLAFILSIFIAIKCSSLWTELEGFIRFFIGLLAIISSLNFVFFLQTIIGWD